MYKLKLKILMRYLFGFLQLLDQLEAIYIALTPKLEHNITIIVIANSIDLRTLRQRRNKFSKYIGLDVAVAGLLRIYFML